MYSYSLAYLPLAYLPVVFFSCIARHYSSLHIVSVVLVLYLTYSCLPDVKEKVQSITIKEGDVGYSYERLFGCCLDGNLEWVEVEDPYIKARHQVHNFVRFCELLVRKGGKKLDRVKLHTGRGEVCGS